MNEQTKPAPDADQIATAVVDEQERREAEKQPNYASMSAAEFRNDVFKRYGYMPPV